MTSGRVPTTHAHRIGHRYRGEQRFRVGMQWRGIKIAGRGGLYDLAEVHHGNVRADMFDHR